jgi:hypothetical protein
MGHQLEAFTAGQQLSLGPADLAPGSHLLLGYTSRVTTADLSITAHLATDSRGGSVDQVGNLAQAKALGMTDLNSGALFNAEFGIRHRGSTVPEGQVLHSVFAAAVIILVLLLMLEHLLKLYV